MIKHHQNRYWVHPLFSIDKTISAIWILECYKKTVTGQIVDMYLPIDAQESTNKHWDGRGMNFGHFSGFIKNRQKSKTVKVLQKSSLSYRLNINYRDGFFDQLLIETNN